MRFTLLCTMAALFTCTTTALAQQFDAPYYKLKERKAAEWDREDAAIDRRLADLERRFGKKPNIIYILTDDVGWGELGWQGGGKHRGTPSKELDAMAFAGMRFWSAYAEPSCTPTRIAIMTGRHPVRTGLLSVLWPGQVEGLSPDEVTVAEVLAEQGYNTAMWGKWHLGEEPHQAPENQGFDYAYYGLFNGAPDAWPDSRALYNSPTNAKAPFYDYPGHEEYKALTGIDLTGPAGYVGRKGQQRQPIEGVAGTLSNFRQEAFENESIDQMTAYIREQADDDDPFFIYWASYAQQICGSEEFKDAEHVDHTNAQASFMAMHNAHVRRLLDTLEEKGIAENTLVVWISDNGPMYAFYPTAGYTLLRGAKGDILEGGVRVPAMAFWPGMIEPNQDPIDVLHVTDLYTTAARIGGALDRLPNDRVTDGLDQTSLFLNGEGHGRRNYMFHYSGGTLGAIRFEDFKIHIRASGGGGLPAMDFYNVKRDPGEKYGAFYGGLFAVTPIQNHLRDHMILIKRFPHRVSEVTPEGAEITPHD